MPRDLFPKPVWVFLIILDFCLLLLGFMTVDLTASALALVLAFLINRYGLETLLGPDHDRGIRLHKKVQITNEQKREIVAALKAERMKRRSGRKEVSG